MQVIKLRLSLCLLDTLIVASKRGGVQFVHWCARVAVACAAFAADRWTLVIILVVVDARSLMPSLWTPAGF